MDKEYSEDYLYKINNNNVSHDSFKYCIEHKLPAEYAIYSKITGKLIYAN